MNIIVIEEEAFYTLVEIVMMRIDNSKYIPSQWVNAQDAMLLLNIKSKSTLAELRYQGKIRYSQPQKKIILYDRASIIEYLEKHSKDKF